MKRTMVALVLVGLLSAIAPATVVNSITDDFSGDLSQWKVLDFSGEVYGATLDFSTQEGKMEALATTLNTSTYIDKVLITNDSVDATINNNVIMSTIFRVSSSNPPKAYPEILMTVTNTSTTSEHLHRNAFSFQANETLSYLYLRSYKTNLAVDSQIQLASGDGSPSLGWSLLKDVDYKLTFALDQDANQLTFTAVSVDGTTPIVNGQTSATAVLTYTSAIWEAPSYYGAYKMNAKSYGNTRSYAMDADDFSLIPEPATMGVLLAGAAGMLLRRRRQ